MKPSTGLYILHFVYNISPSHIFMDVSVRLYKNKINKIIWRQWRMRGHRTPSDIPMKNMNFPKNKMMKKST